MLYIAYRGSPIFRKRKRNPLSLQTNVVLNPRRAPAASIHKSPLEAISDDLAAADINLRETMPAYSIVGSYLFELLKVEINKTEGKYTKLLTKHGFTNGKEIETEFSREFLLYTLGRYPFNQYTQKKPRMYWENLKKRHPEALLLAVSLSAEVTMY